MPPDRIEAFLEGLSPNAIRSLPWLFEHWAHAAHQLPPCADWTTWVLLGGRGAGKTRAGAEWVRAQVEGPRPHDPGRCRRVALIGETLDQAREVMVFGPSGLMACSPPDRRPAWQATRRRLVWPNGAEAMTFSAMDPESLRGPQFDAAWADELAKWRRGQDAWDMLQFALRLGPDPRVVVTTTPRDSALLRSILKAPGTVETRAPTAANRMHLAKGFIDRIRALYGSGPLGRQEIEGEMLEGFEGALWSPALIEAARAIAPPRPDRIVVAVDPPVSSGNAADTCGIVVAGVTMEGPPQDWKAVVLEDASLQGASPDGWAQRAIAAFHRHRADRLVAEANQGGNLIEALIRGSDALIPYKAVHAAIGKARRAEPVAALYEQGRVAHAGPMPALEDQMLAMTVAGYRGRGSPDRLDALVWALTELMIEPARARIGRPAIRSL